MLIWENACEDRMLQHGWAGEYMAQAFGHNTRTAERRDRAQRGGTHAIKVNGRDISADAERRLATEGAQCLSMGRGIVWQMLTIEVTHNQSRHANVVCTNVLQCRKPLMQIGIVP